MAQVIDTTGRSKGFSKKEWVPPVRVPNRRPSGRVSDNANYNELADNIISGLTRDQNVPPASPASRQKENSPDWIGLANSLQSPYRSMARQFDHATSGSHTLDAEMPMWAGETPGMQTNNNGVELPKADTGASMSDAWRVSGSASGALADKEIEDTRAGIEQLDPRITMVGDTPENQAYLDYAAEKGDLSDEDVDMIRNHDELGSLWDRLWLNSGIQELSSNKDHIRKGEGYDDFITPDEYDSSLQTGSAEAIDDGTTYDYDHMTSNWMTGTQYLRYRQELGMEGRPIDEIDPTGIYNKMSEANDYGFTPFLPDWWSLAGGVAANSALSLSNVGNAAGRLRDLVTDDYVINVGDRSISGRDFDRRITPFMDQNYYYSIYEPERYLRAPSDGNATPYVYEYQIPDVNGNMTYHYGDMVTDENGSIPESDYDPQTGIITLRFSDGSAVEANLDDVIDRDNQWTFGGNLVKASDASGALPDDLDSLNDVERIMQLADENDASPMSYASVIYYPDLQLSDGSTVSYDDAWRIYSDSTPDDDEGAGDDDISYEFSGIRGTTRVPFLPDNRPSRFVNYEPVSHDDEGWHIDWGAIPNYAFDATTGSLPISISNGFWNPWAYSVSSAIPSIAGVNPQTYDLSTGSYLPIAGSYDDDGNLVYGVQDRNGVNDELSDQTRMWNAIGTALVPATEEIAGDIGGSNLINDLLKISDAKMPANPTARRLLLRNLFGPIGEGLEEIVGNHFDEMTGYGLQGMWASPLYDESGDVMRDLVGHEIRDYDTSVGDRASNASDWEDMANAMLGGIAVSTVMGIPEFPSRLGEMRRAIARDNVDRRQGLRPLVEPTSGMPMANPGDEYLSSFSNVPPSASEFGYDKRHDPFMGIPSVLPERR